MSKGIIYLIQPAELIGTNRYKIGMSKSPTLDRVRTYKKGTRYLCIMETENSGSVELEIKSEFKKEFNLVAGYEYFEGQEDKLIFFFLDIVTGLKKRLIKKKNHYKPKHKFKWDTSDCHHCNYTGKYCGDECWFCSGSGKDTVASESETEPEPEPEPEIKNLEIGDTIFEHGKHTGKCYKEVRESFPSYFLYLVGQPVGSVYEYLDFINYCMTKFTS